MFLDHVLCCFISDPVGLELIHHFNIDNVCWECDYPHSDSTWPDSPERVAAEFAALDDEQVAKITHLNAMRHYRFDPFTDRPPEAGTVGALRAEVGAVDTVTHVGRRADGRDVEAFMSMRQRIKGPANA